MPDAVLRRHELSVLAPLGRKRLKPTLDHGVGIDDEKGPGNPASPVTRTGREAFYPFPDFPETPALGARVVVVDDCGPGRNPSACPMQPQAAFHGPTSRVDRTSRSRRYLRHSCPAFTESRSAIQTRRRDVASPQPTFPPTDLPCRLRQFGHPLPGTEKVWQSFRILLTFVENDRNMRELDMLKSTE